MDPQVAHDLFNPVISQIAIAAVQLQALVGCSAADFGAKFFGHGANIRQGRGAKKPNMGSAHIITSYKFVGTGSDHLKWVKRLETFFEEIHAEKTAKHNIVR